MSTRATQYAKVEPQLAVMSVHIRSTSMSRLLQNPWKAAYLHSHHCVRKLDDLQQVAISPSFSNWQTQVKEEHLNAGGATRRDSFLLPSLRLAPAVLSCSSWRWIASFLRKVGSPVSQKQNSAIPSRCTHDHHTSDVVGLPGSWNGRGGSDVGVHCRSVL